MPASFAELYRTLTKDVFLDLARQQMEQGADGLLVADTYAEQGKPDFALAYLLLIEISDEVKRDIFARSYEQRALISEQKAIELSQKHHRSFPLIQVEAQKDRVAARQVRQGKPVHRDAKSLPINLIG
jgi:hypothetical protein